VSGPDIFISYSREDRPAARHFAESFTREGFDVWWDAAIRSGQTFDEVIEKALRSAKAVVVLWSPRSVASRWVRAEATLADRANKLVPAIIEACDRPIIFELTHAVDLADWTGDTSDSRWQTLVSDLRRLVGDSADASPAPSEPEKPTLKPDQSKPAPSISADPKSQKDSDDELMQALERLARARESKLSAPTPQEEERTRFYNRSEEERAKPADKVHCLLRLDGEEQETRFVITPAGLKVGRTAPADIIVSGSGVSRAHCMVEMAADQVRVTDLNSTNGTYIDNKRIDRTVMLPVGSVLRIGTVSFEHEVRTPEEAPQQLASARSDSDAILREARLARH
jgi:hypothetical protein